MPKGNIIEEQPATCYKPVPGKHLWIKPPLNCIIPEPNDPNRQEKLDRFKRLKECYGFSDIALYMDFKIMTAAKDAGLGPEDITLIFDPCKLREAQPCKDNIPNPCIRTGKAHGWIWEEYCNGDAESLQEYEETIRKSIEWWIIEKNNNLGLTERDMRPFKRIWIDEPNSGANFSCDFSCDGTVISYGREFITGISSDRLGLPVATDFRMPGDVIPTGVLNHHLFLQAVYNAIKFLRSGSNTRTSEAFRLGETQTQFVISNYRATFSGIGRNWIKEQAGLADTIYPDNYTHNNPLNYVEIVNNIWNIDGVNNGAFINLALDRNFYVGLLATANKNGWTDMALFATEDQNMDPITDCDKWEKDLAAFCEAAVATGWLARVPQKVRSPINPLFVPIVFDESTASARIVRGYDAFIRPATNYPNPFG